MGPIEFNRCYVGDCRVLMREWIRAGVKVQTVVTSPPYWGLRDYGHPGQIGLERTLVRYLARMRGVLRLVRELLTDDGTLWLNMGDAYVTRPNGGIGRTSQINGKSSHTAYRQAQAYRGRKTPLATGLTMKHKDLMGQPWLLALLLRADGWYLRQDIVWHKPAPMPESVKDRCTKAHEYLFLLSKSENYYWDFEAMQEPVSGTANARGAGVNPKAVAGWATGPGNHSTVEHASPKYRDADERHRTKQGLAASERKFRPRSKQNESFSAAVSGLVEKRNRRSVWTVPSEPFAGAHFATYPRRLVEPCVLAGSRPGDVVFDPFMGSGTTAQVAHYLGRQWLGCELSEDYLALQEERLRQPDLFSAKEK